MPILAAAGQVIITPPPVTDVPVVVPVWTEDVGTMTATWIDPTGKEWPLSTTDEEIGWFTTNGPAGWGATPIEIVTDPLPRGGEQVRFIRSKPKRIQWPVYVGGPDHLEYTRRRRQITRAFTMTTQRMAPGWLKVARGDGTARLIAGYYEQGWEGDAGQDFLFSRNVIQLFCPDGYWSDVGTYTVERGFDTAALTPFLNPFLTIVSSRISSGSVEDPPVVVDNPGDVEAWPVWTLTGPLTKLTAESLTLGSRFAFEYPLAAGQQVVITTNRPHVRGPGDANLSKYVDWFNPVGTELWPLMDGRNEIRFYVENAGTGTHVLLSYTPRYETA